MDDAAFEAGFECAVNTACALFDRMGDDRAAAAVRKQLLIELDAVRAERTARGAGPGEVDRLRRVVVAVAYATLAAVDSSGTLTMDLNHRESVSLALKSLLADTRDTNPAASYTNNGTAAGKQCESLKEPGT